MSFHAKISLNLPPNIDVTKASIAYGNWAPDRFKRELASECLLTRQRSVNAFPEYLWDHANIASSIKAGCIHPLVNLLSDKDKTCRQLAAKSCIVLNQSAIGRDSLIEFNALKPLTTLMKDEHEICRLNAQKAVSRMAEVPMGCWAIIATENLLETLIYSIKNDTDGIKEVALSTTGNCITVKDDNVHDLLEKLDFLKICTDLLEHPNEKIGELVSRNISAACIHRKGKISAVKLGIVSDLIQKLNSEDWRTQSSAVLGLANICAVTEGKYAAINDFGVEKIIPLLEHTQSEVRVNALKALGSLAEAPEGRSILFRRLPCIEKLLSDTNRGVKRQAKITLNIVCWKP